MTYLACRRREAAFTNMVSSSAREVFFGLQLVHKPDGLQLSYFPGVILITQLHQYYYIKVAV